MRPVTFRLLLISGILLAVFCANPTDQGLHWQEKIEIPVSNQAFILGDQFKKLFKGFKDLTDFRILGLGDTNVAGLYDTGAHVLAFSKLTRDTFSFKQSHDSMEVKIFDESVGIIPISGLGAVSQRAVLPVSGAIAADAPFNFADTVHFSNKVRSVTFAAQSPSLQLQLSNNTGADIDSLIITILNADPVVPASQPVSLTTAAPTAALSFAVGGSTIDSVLRVRVQGKVKAPATVNGAGGIMLSSTLDNLTATRVTIMDSLISFKKDYFNLYKITDSVDIDYVDILEGFFSYSCDNRSGLPLNVTGIHQHLWISSICERDTIDSVADLGKLAHHFDSTHYYSGEITQGPRTIPAHSNLVFGKINISGNRLFPHWDTADGGNSVTRVDYVVESAPPTGAWITLRSSDSLIFTISPASVNFRQFSGTMALPYLRSGDTQYVQFPWPWPKAGKDSLRGKFNLSLVLSDTRVTTRLPGRGYLDSLYTEFTLLDPAHPTDNSDTTVVFTSIKNDTGYQRSLRVTKIVNYFPDSIAVVTHTTIPKGTHVFVVNDQALDPAIIGAMTIYCDVDYRLNAYLDWSVSDSATMDIGSGSFEISRQNMHLIRAMHDRRVTINADIANYTNVYVRLFALVAPGSTKALVDSLPTDSMLRLISVPGKAEDNGYVNLFGPGGLYVPDRNLSASSSVDLNDRQIDMIMQSDSAAWRWLIRFYRNSRDSLMNVDSVKIKSWLHAEGVQYMDSVFNAF